MLKVLYGFSSFSTNCVFYIVQEKFMRKSEYVVILLHFLYNKNNYLGNVVIRMNILTKIYNCQNDYYYY